MRQFLAITVITLLAIGTGCAWISPSSQAASDGIQVHGHWTVTVSNPDGTVDAVHEFDNAITLQGKHAVATILSGVSNIRHGAVFNSNMGDLQSNGWLIRLQGDAVSGQKTNTLLDCQEELIGPEIGISASLLEGVILIPSVNFDPGNGEIDLFAYCTVTKAGAPVSINMVQTLFAEQEGTSFSFPSFTQHDLIEPIEVEKNQGLSFNISISFE